LSRQAKTEAKTAPSFTYSDRVAQELIGPSRTETRPVDRLTKKPTYEREEAREGRQSGANPHRTAAAQGPR
jgi:hypothetical protein